MFQNRSNIVSLFTISQLASLCNISIAIDGDSKHTVAYTRQSCIDSNTQKQKKQTLPQYCIYPELLTSVYIYLDKTM